MKRWLIWMGLLSAQMASAEVRICTDCYPENFGDIVTRNSTWRAAWIGHSAVQSAPDQFADVKGNREKALTLSGSLGAFLMRETGAEYWGALRPDRESGSGLTDVEKAALKAQMRYYASFNTEYDDNHLNQKGAYFEPSWLNSEGYWEFDCVGFIERVYEDIGINLTDDSHESGWGWPLTPREMRDYSRTHPIR